MQQNREKLFGKMYDRVTKLPPLLRYFHKVESGYDPVDPKYADFYADREWKGEVENMVNGIEKRLGTLAGLRVLDLGAGPGQYSVAFALRGARVTWHDPSRAYLRIAQEHARQSGVTCEWSLGFLEAADGLKNQPFDLVFCRGCWYYCVSDARFADIVFRLVKPGGSAWLDIPTAAWQRVNQGKKAGFLLKMAWAIYRHTGLKIVYSMPEGGNICRLFCRYDSLKRLEFDLVNEAKELLWLQR